MGKNFNLLEVSNEKYDIYVTEKVFFGYTIKKFIKGSIVGLVQKIDINETLSKTELEQIAYSMLD